MRKVLFWRVFVPYLVILPILFFPVDFYVSSVMKDSFISRLKDNLTAEAHLIAAQIPESFSENMDAFCREYKEKTGARITLIDSAGRVVGDSDESSEKMENHFDRPEIQEAIATDLGSSVRFSKTLGRNSFYLAVRLNHGRGNGFLRLSVPLQDMERALSQVRTRILFASVLTFLIVLLIGLLQTRRITKSVEEIAAFLKEVAAGNLERRLFLKEKGVIGELVYHINAMAKELKDGLIECKEERYLVGAILSSMSDGLMLVDRKGDIVLCNQAVKNTFGIEGAAEGKSLMETLKSPSLMELFAKVLEKEETMSLEIHVFRPNDCYLMAVAVPFYSYEEKEKISGVVLSLHDITRLRLLEEVRKDFVANVSHEIKTPITAIRGFAETLLEGAIDDRENAHKFLRTIKNHSERLNLLVSDLLTLSGIELGDIRIEKRTVSLDDVIDSVFTTLAEKAERKGLYLVKDISEQAGDVMADRDRLVQILLNLVDNGIKFTEEGGVMVGVEVRKDEGAQVGQETGRAEYTEIYVEDTGIGIPRKDIPRLGERFYRVDRARSRELGGTGLGLAIVKHLIKAHGWEMKIESTFGWGTKARILVYESKP
jgi:two-component system, OmpR family, phosphate regulon sensor histidine kinase PhoR